MSKREFNFCGFSSLVINHIFHLGELVVEHHWASSHFLEFNDIGLIILLRLLYLNLNITAFCNILFAIIVFLINGGLVNDLGTILFMFIILSLKHLGKEICNVLSWQLCHEIWLGAGMRL